MKTVFPPHHLRLCLLFLMLVLHGAQSVAQSETLPEPINVSEITARIGYPPMAKEAEIQGQALVRVLVGTSGNYIKHVVLKDPHPILTRAVTDALPALRFKPYLENGSPINVWVTIPFDFKLDKGNSKEKAKPDPMIKCTLKDIQVKIQRVTSKRQPKVVNAPYATNLTFVKQNIQQDLRFSKSGTSKTLFQLELDKEGRVMSVTLLQAPDLNQDDQKHLTRHVNDIQWWPAEAKRKSVGCIIHVTIELVAE